MLYFTCLFFRTKIGENSDITKCLEFFVTQALGFLTRFYTAELRYKKTYRPIKTQVNADKNLSEGEFVALTVEENLSPEQPTHVGWQVERLVLRSPAGDEMEIKCTNLYAVSELLRKMS